jgi:hypothetical protein
MLTTSIRLRVEDDEQVTATAERRWYSQDITAIVTIANQSAGSETITIVGRKHKLIELSRAMLAAVEAAEAVEVSE